MDVDAATEADDHTPWTAIDEPIASAIFGTAESIAYARTRGTPFGPIRFSAAMARFVLPTQLIPSADSVTLVSLQRRNVPLSSDHHASASPGPLGFDKPSNALFLPPEFSSLNCYMCVAWITGGGTPSISINGSVANPVPVAFGTQETISVAGSGQCWAEGYHFNYETYEWYPDGPGVGQFIHYFNFGDGTGHERNTNGTDPDTVVGKTHYAPGLYTVTDDVWCACWQSTMFYDALPTTGRNVEVWYHIELVTAQ